MKNAYSEGWFSILLALGLTILMSFIGLYLMEYMIPFSRNIQGVENASKAFLQSYSGIEDSFYEVYKGEPGTTVSKPFLWWEDFRYNVTSSWVLLPLAWQGNSPYDDDWNRISSDEPVQLLIGKWRLTSGSSRIQVLVRVPDYSNNAISASDNDRLKENDGNDELILWQLASWSDTLITLSWALMTELNINDMSSSINPTERNIWWETGTRLNRSDVAFSSFYASDCSNTNQECIFKLTLVNDLLGKDDGTWATRIFPYLEYQVFTSDPIPLQLPQVLSEGRSFDFTKRLEAAIPQDTTNTAFDFTIFQ